MTEERTKIRKDQIQTILDHKAINTSSRWSNGKLDRIYINLVGNDKSFRGDNTHKVFIDKITNEFVLKMGKSICSDLFGRNVCIIQDFVKSITTKGEKKMAKKKSTRGNKKQEKKQPEVVEEKVEETLEETPEEPILTLMEEMNKVMGYEPVLKPGETEEETKQAIIECLEDVQPEDKSAFTPESWKLLMSLGTAPEENKEKADSSALPKILGNTTKLDDMKELCKQHKEFKNINTDDYAGLKGRLELREKMYGALGLEVPKAKMVQKKEKAEEVPRSRYGARVGTISAFIDDLLWDGFEFKTGVQKVLDQFPDKTTKKLEFCVHGRVRVLRNKGVVVEISNDSEGKKLYKTKTEKI